MFFKALTFLLELLVCIIALIILIRYDLYDFLYFLIAFGLFIYTFSIFIHFPQNKKGDIDIEDYSHEELHEMFENIHSKLSTLVFTFGVCSLMLVAFAFLG